MGRASNRPRILAAVLEVIDQSGIAGVTIEAVAEQAGMTVQGVLYHFASREDLMAAAEAAMWVEAEAITRSALRDDDNPPSIEKKREAYVRGYLSAQLRPAELLLDIERALTKQSSTDAERFHVEWTAPDQATVMQLIALLAADGLRLNEVLGRPTPQRERIVEQILAIMKNPPTA